MAWQEKLRQFLKNRSGLALNLLFFGAVFIGVSSFQMRNMLSASGVEAPDLAGPLLSGGYYDLAAVNVKPVVVYFFAPWCKFCAVSSDNLTRLRRFRDSESLEILAVALDWQNRDEVLDYVERHELNVPVVLGDRNITNEWHVYAFPTYYVLDSRGQIRHRDLGYSTQFGLWWRSWFVD
jgi:peroxiredoxin